MNKTDLTAWFLNDFWPIYLNLMKVPNVTKWGAGDRGEALKKALTLNPGEDLRKRMTASVVAQMAHRRSVYEKCGSMQAYMKKTDRDTFYCNRNGKTWIFNLGWEAEIPAVSHDRRSMPETENGLRCKSPGCKGAALGASVPFCATCEHKKHQPYFPLMREYLKKHGLTKNQDETITDYSLRCRAHRKTIKGLSYE